LHSGSSTVFTYPLTFAALHGGVTSLVGLRGEQTSKQLSRRLWQFPDASVCTLLGVLTVAALCVDNVAFVNNLGGSVLGAPLMYDMLA
jgi:hypothetical protein